MVWVCWALVAGWAAAEEPTLAELVSDPRWARAEVGLSVVRVRTGEVVHGWRDDQPMVPASAMKAVTAAAALRALGPSHHFDTEVWVTGEVVEGVLEGDVVFVGHGDATLMADDVWRMLRDLRSSGVERVRGNLVLDDTFFDEGPRIPGWTKAGDLADGPSYFAPIGALGLEFGGVTLVVRPGPREGSPAVALLETPAAGFVRVQSTALTGSDRSRTRLELERRVEGDHVDLVLSGSVPMDAAPRRFRRAVHDATGLFGGVVEALLGSVGPTLEGKVVRGTLPEVAKRLQQHASPPLGSILMDMNKYSSNYMAESVLRSVGAVVRGEGTTANGLAVVRAHLDAIGVAPEESVLVNGSGLSYEARLSPRALTAVLVDAARDPRIGPELVASLAIAGRDGTLDDRLEDVEGRVRAKTGTLADVTALAGFVEAADREIYAFAFFANAIQGPVDNLQRLADEVALRIARLGAP